MDGYEDFGRFQIKFAIFVHEKTLFHSFITVLVKLNKQLPSPCCNVTTDICEVVTAQSANVTGCRDKIVKSSTDTWKALMYTSTIAILFQVIFKFKLCIIRK